jgi:acetylornithine deacetylase/succinyl-diaminopimelate desuccinylase-like protein
LLKHRRELIDAEYSLNADCCDLLTRNGKPYSFSLSAGEKKEVILQLVTRNRGGHGSRPREDNSIYDMQAVARNPPDPTAVDRLSKDPFYNALLRTTCVATMLKAGHGPSALPQRAEATLNCRILPGQTSAWLLNTLREAIGDDGVAISWQFNEPSDPPASALRPDLFSAVKKAVDSMVSLPGGPAPDGAIDPFETFATARFGAHELALQLPNSAANGLSRTARSRPEQQSQQSRLALFGGPPRRTKDISIALLEAIELPLRRHTGGRLPRRFDRNKNLKPPVQHVGHE